jgi:hypothetical protein
MQYSFQPKTEQNPSLHVACVAIVAFVGTLIGYSVTSTYFTPALRQYATLAKPMAISTSSLQASPVGMKTNHSSFLFLTCSRFVV